MFDVNRQGDSRPTKRTVPRLYRRSRVIIVMVEAMWSRGRGFRDPPCSEQARPALFEKSCTSPVHPKDHNNGMSCAMITWRMLNIDVVTTTYLVLLLPLIALLLKSLHTAFKLFSFDVDLSEPVQTVSSDVPSITIGRMPATHFSTTSLECCSAVSSSSSKSCTLRWRASFVDLFDSAS